MVQNDKTPAHAFQTKSKPTAAETQTEEVRDWCKEKVDIQRIKQSKRQDMDTNIQTHTRSCTVHTPQRHQVGHNRQNLRPNQRRGGRAAQTKHHWQTACFCCTPSPEEHATKPIKTPQIPGHLDDPSPHSESSSWPGLT